ncbi:MAG TPA: hypothetical protein VI911_10910 [Patescibacteria group bacterium]|nr:hypothetical protein [Patescibacteria group bacterium]
MIIACVNCYKHHTVHYGLNECPECGKELFLIDTREDDIENIASMMNDARDNDTIRKEVNNFKQESNMTIEQEVEEEANRLFDLRQRKDHPEAAGSDYVSCMEDAELEIADKYLEAKAEKDEEDFWDSI